VIVCHCEIVRESEIRDAIVSGASDLAAVARCTRAGMTCQGCWPALQALLAEAGSSRRQTVGASASGRA